MQRPCTKYSSLSYLQSSANILQVKWLSLVIRNVKGSRWKIPLCLNVSFPGCLWDNTCTKANSALCSRWLGSLEKNRIPNCVEEFSAQNRHSTQVAYWFLLLYVFPLQMQAIQALCLNFISFSPQWSCKVGWMEREWLTQCPVLEWKLELGFHSNPHPTV